MTTPRAPKPVEKMGFFHALSEMRALYSSHVIENQIKENIDRWMPMAEHFKLIADEAKKMLEVLKESNQAAPDQPVVAEAKNISEDERQVTEFLEMANDMIAKGKTLADLLTPPKLYYFNSKAEAEAIESRSAVVIYKGQNGQHYLRGSEPIFLKDWKFTVDENGKGTITKVNFAFNDTYPVISIKGEIQFTGEKSKELDKVTRQLGESMEIEGQQLFHAVTLAQGIPALLKAAAELPIERMLAKKLDETDDPTLAKRLKQANKFIEKSEEKLQAALQEDIYEKYFTNEGSEEPPVWISEAGKAFIHVKKIMQKIDELQKKAPAHLSDSEKIAFRIKQASELARIGKSLFTALNKIKKNLPLLSELPEEMMQHAGALAKTAIGTFDQVASVIGQIKKSKEPLLDMIQALETAILKHAKGIQDEKLRTEATTAVNNINALLEKLASIGKKPPANLLEFARNNLSNIQNALTSLPKILDTLSKLSLEEAEKMTLQIEGTLQTIVALGQSLEREFFLKPGYLTSGVQTTLQDFQKKSAEIKAKIEEARADPLAFVAQKLAEHGVELSPEAREEMDSNIDMAKAFIRRARNELLERLDPDIYKQYFSGELEMKAGEDNSHWIAQAGKAFVTLEKIIERINELNEEPKTKNPFELVELRKKQIIELALANKELMTAFRKIKENPILNKLVSIEIPSLKAGAVGQAGEQEKLAIMEIKMVLDPLEIMASKLGNILKEEKENFNDSLQAKKDKVFRNTVRADIKNLLGTMLELDGKFEKFRKSVDVAAGEKPNLLKFAYQNFSDIKDILTILPIILEKLNELSTEEAKKMAIEINNTLKNIVLLSDKLEIQLCLKEGSLTENLKHTIDTYRVQVRKLGYDFSPENGYPYSEAIRAQRERLLQSPDFAFQKELIKKRMESPRQVKTIKPLNDQKIKKEIDDLVRLHIDHLKTLKKGKEINKKIELLEILLEDKSPLRLEEKLEKLKCNQETSKYVHLLYQGNTGEVLKRLENKSVPPEAIFNQLSAELIKLKRQRGNTHYFYKQTYARLLEEKIQILEKLQILLETNNLKDALGKLQESELSILERYDSSFIKNLKLFEERMHSENKPKTILGTHSVTNDPVISPKATLLAQQDERQHAINLIDQRIGKLNSPDHSDKKQKQIVLLKELRRYLSEKEDKPMSLETAILKLKTDHANDIHLLFEGSLGKTMKAAQSLTITRAELIHRLDIEINNMKQQRYTHLYLFSTSRKQNLDKHIQSLEMIKKELQAPDKGSVADIVRKHKDVLKRYEPDLVKELERFKRPSEPITPGRSM